MERKSIGIWIRVSTEDQAKGESPEHHEHRARAYADLKGWTVETVYHLEGVSGKSVMDHAEAKRMLIDVRSGKISGIIFSKLARLARNTRELLDFADIFREFNADLISLQESIDTSTPAGRLFYTMIAAMAQWEREEISSRVAASVPVRAKLGKPIGGQASFGYQWDSDRQLVIDEKEAPVRKLIYELFVKLKRKKAVAGELNKLGYRTRNGSKFSDTTVERLLRDPSAKGERRANYTKSLGEGKHWNYKPKEEWIIIPCDKIVEPELWDECNRILDAQYKKRTPTGPRPTYLLAGYIFCHCGEKMYVYHTSEMYKCKECKNRIGASDIDEIYQEQLKSFLLTDTELTNYLKQSDSLIQEKQTLLDNRNKEASNLRKKMDELVKLRLDQELSKESFKTHYSPLEQQLQQIDLALPELQAEIDFLRMNYLSSDLVLQEAKDLYSQWPTMPFEEKRAIIETITLGVFVGIDEITFSLAYLPSFQNGGNRQRNLTDS